MFPFQKLGGDVGAACGVKSVGTIAAFDFRFHPGTARSGLSRQIAEGASGNGV